jgi:hypothetical protein
VAVAEPKAREPQAAPVAATPPPTPVAPEQNAPDATQQILNDPLVKRAVELFNARVVHVEPWTRQ